MKLDKTKIIFEKWEQLTNKKVKLLLKNGEEKITEDAINIRFKDAVDVYFQREFKFNFEIKKNKNYLISTENLSSQKILIELIMGLRRPQRGRIEFNNHDIENVDLEHLRSQIAIIDNGAPIS